MHFKKNVNFSSCGDAEPESADNACSVSRIVFPPDHVLCRLQALWKGTDDRENPLQVSLPTGDDFPVSFSDEVISQESGRLQCLLTDAAEARIKEIFAAPSSVDLDEMALIMLSDDEMFAWLLLLPPVGHGVPLSAPQIGDLLVKHGVVRGINWGLLRSLSTCPQRYFHLFPIACGTPPVQGQDGSVIDRYPRRIRENVTVDELGQADYTALGLVQDIQENEVICEIIPPTPGTPGNTITGTVLPVRDGVAAHVPQGRNTRLSEDGRYLVAAQEGHLVFSGRDFKVNPVLHLHESDFDTVQDIKFLGDVHIHCDLSRENTVCAMGMVQIDGVAEGCTVEAGESIIVSSGVQGQDMTVLHAQKSVYAKYLENCCVYARESVQADCIINSSICSNGTVKVCTGRGAIIGGTIRAAQTVYATSVGSKAERPTAIILGGDPCEEAERVQVQKEIDRIEHELSDLGGRRLDAAGQQNLSKLRLKQCVARMNLEKLDKEMAEKQAIALSCDMRRLHCNTLYPGATVTIDHDIYQATQVERDCTIGRLGGSMGRL